MKKKIRVDLDKIIFVFLYLLLFAYGMFIVNRNIIWFVIYATTLLIFIYLIMRLSKTLKYLKEYCKALEDYHNEIKKILEEEK